MNTGTNAEVKAGVKTRVNAGGDYRGVIPEVNAGGNKVVRGRVNKRVNTVAEAEVNTGVSEETDAVLNVVNAGVNTGINAGVNMSKLWSDCEGEHRSEGGS